MTRLKIASTLCFCLLSLAATSEQATAALTYQIDLERLGPADAPNKVSVAMVLREVDDGLDASPDSALAKGSGLFGIGIRLERTQGDATLSGFRLADGFGPFGANPTPNPTETESLWEFNIVSSNAFGDSPGFGTLQSSFTVGTVDITIGRQESVFRLGNLTAALPNNLSLGQNAFTQRADRISEYGSINVSAVPEPASGSFAMLIGSLICFVRRRKTAAVLDRLNT
ncbi:hypothetical protein [Novipirellula aureliae]|nr:hypothetical protein [Novipirellula aureliae]